MIYSGHSTTYKLKLYLILVAIIYLGKGAQCQSGYPQQDSSSIKKNTNKKHHWGVLVQGDAANNTFIVEYDYREATYNSIVVFIYDRYSTFLDSVSLPTRKGKSIIKYPNLIPGQYFYELYYNGKSEGSREFIVPVPQYREIGGIKYK
jgi:hypothetical protein